MSAEIPSPDVKPEVVIPDSKAALRRIGLGVVVSIGIAVAQVLAEAFPALAVILQGMLPAWLALVAPFIEPVALAIQSFLLKQAARYHKDSVKEAIETIPPSSLKKYY